MFCANCGSRIPDNAKFCTICGAPVEPMPGAEVTPDSASQPGSASEAAPERAVSAGQQTDVPQQAPAPQQTAVPPQAVGFVPADQHPAVPQQGAIAPEPVIPSTRLRGTSRYHGRSHAHGHSRQQGFSQYQDYSQQQGFIRLQSYSQEQDYLQSEGQPRTQEKPQPQEQSQPQEQPQPQSIPQSQPQPQSQEQPHSQQQSFPQPESYSRQYDASYNRYTAERKRRSSVSTALIAAVAAVAVGVVVVFAGTMTDWFGLTAQDADTTEPVEEAETTSEEDAADASTDEDAEDTTDEPTVRAAVEDYSWEELSQISQLISSAESDEEALEIAENYNLCTSDGLLDGTQTKELTLSDGTSVTMQVAGFNHDELADGSGVAGITFVSRGIVATRQMNSTNTTAGGWRDSSLREWMNSDLVDLLPDDVAAVVAPVIKYTNSVGATSDTSSVVGTEDTLWTLSYAEICGDMDVDSDPRDAVFNAEGSQYQLFSDLDVSWDAPNEILQISGVDGWWERTPDPMDGRYYMNVGADGTPWYAHGPTRELGVVMCFCV